MTRDHRRKHGKKPVEVTHRQKANPSSKKIRINTIKNSDLGKKLFEEMDVVDKKSEYPARDLVGARLKSLAELHGIVGKITAPAIDTPIDYEMTNKLKTQWGSSHQFLFDKIIENKIVPDITYQQLHWTSRMVSPYSTDHSTHEPPINTLLRDYHSKTLGPDHQRIKTEIKELFFANGLGELTDENNPLIKNYLGMEETTADEYVRDVIAVKVVEGTFIQPLKNEFEYKDELISTTSPERFVEREPLGSVDQELPKFTDVADLAEAYGDIDTILTNEFFLEDYTHEIEFDRTQGTISIDIDESLSDAELKTIEVDVADDMREALEHHPGLKAIVSQDRFGNINVDIGEIDLAPAQIKPLSVMVDDTPKETEIGFEREQELTLNVSKDHERDAQVITPQDQEKTFEIEQEKIRRTLKRLSAFKKRKLDERERELKSWLIEDEAIEEDFDKALDEIIHETFIDVVALDDLSPVTKKKTAKIHETIKKDVYWKADLERETVEREVVVIQTQIIALDAIINLKPTFKRKRKRRRVRRFKRLSEHKRRRRRRMTKKELKEFVEKYKIELDAEQKKKADLITQVDDAIESDKPLEILPKQKKQKQTQVVLAELSDIEKSNTSNNYK